MSNMRTRSEVKRVIKVLVACFVAPIILITALPLILIVIILTGNKEDLAELDKLLIYLSSLGD